MFGFAKPVAVQWAWGNGPMITRKYASEAVAWSAVEGLWGNALHNPVELFCVVQGPAGAVFAPAPVAGPAVPAAVEGPAPMVVPAGPVPAAPALV